MAIVLGVIEEFNILFSGMLSEETPVSKATYVEQEQ
jgi:hypothetical protein